MAQYGSENAVVGNRPQIALMQSALNLIRTSVPTLYDALNTGAAAYLYLSQIRDRKHQKRVNEQLQRDQARDREVQRIINERLRKRGAFFETVKVRHVDKKTIKSKFRSSHVPISTEHKVNKMSAIPKAFYGAQPKDRHPAGRRRRTQRN